MFSMKHHVAVHALCGKVHNVSAPNEGAGRGGCGLGDARYLSYMHALFSQNSWPRMLKPSLPELMRRKSTLLTWITHPLDVTSMEWLQIQTDAIPPWCLAIRACRGQNTQSPQVCA